MYIYLFALYAKLVCKILSKYFLKLNLSINLTSIISVFRQEIPIAEKNYKF